jgi:hypothetical protein
MPDADLDTAIQPTDAITLLEAEHRRLLDICAQFQASTDPAARKGLADNLNADLDRHCLIAEEFVLPAVRRLSSDQSAADAVDAGHREAGRLAEELAEAGPADARFERLLGDLSRVIGECVDKERETLFPALRSLGAEELISLGRKMKERREDALHPEADSDAPAGID